MVEEGGSDVIKMSKQGEETPSQLVVPHLSNNLIITKDNYSLQNSEIVAIIELHMFDSEI